MSFEDFASLRARLANVARSAAPTISYNVAYLSQVTTESFSTGHAKLLLTTLSKLSDTPLLGFRDMFGNSVEIAFFVDASFASSEDMSS